MIIKFIVYLKHKYTKLIHNYLPLHKHTLKTSNILEKHITLKLHHKISHNTFTEEVNIKKKHN